MVGWLVWLGYVTWCVSWDRERVLLLWQILDNSAFYFSTILLQLFCLDKKYAY